MSLEYADEKFGWAVETLATHRAAIKERLVAALHDIGSVQMERDVPEGLHDEYQEFWHSVTKAKSRLAGEGSLQATVREMTEDEAVEAAKLITRFAGEFERRLAEERQDSSRQ